MRILLCLFLLLTSNLIFAQSRMDIEDKVKLDSLVASTYEDNKPGGIAAIISKGKTLYKNGSGLSNIEYGISITDSTIFNVGSITKQITAFVALLLEEEGKLSLDDDITKYLPELSSLPHRITIRHFLNHTHGLPNSEELALLCGKERMSHQEIVSMLLKINTTNFSPGDKYEYNNTGYTLVAEIISRVEDKPFQTVLIEKVFEPLGMKNSTIIDNPFQVVKNKAVSYGGGNDQYSYLFNDRSSMGPGGICTDINDLSLWASNFTDPKVGNREMIVKMKKITELNSGEIVKYGLGIQSKEYRGKEVIFHGGADAAYRSYLMHLPEYDCSIITLSNDGSFSALETAHTIADILMGLDNEEKIIIETVNESSDKDETLYAGTYEMFPGKYFNIISRNDSLFLQQFGYTFEILLKHLNGRSYEIPMLPKYKIEFGEDNFDFHIVDSKFICNRVNIDPPQFGADELSKFEGVYINEAFGIMYRITVKDGSLIANSNYDLDIQLYPLADLSFYSSLQYFGRLDFNENTEGELDRFNLSGSFLKDLVFVRMN